jgi:hypothetical protein
VSSTAKGEPTVAQVVLKPRSGREITGQSIIRADNLEDYVPDPSDADTVAGTLADAGFEVGPVGGIAMSVAGPRSLFERYFGTKVEPSDEGGWVAVDRSGAATRELPLNALPDPVAQRVHAITFEPPVEVVLP